MSHDEDAIRKLIHDWLGASMKGDVPTVLGLMADDVLFMVPGQKPFGKAQFEAGARAMKDTRMEAHSDVREVHVAGDWAWCRTELAVTITPPGGSPVRRSGSTLSILRREPDGTWVIVRDANMLATA